MVEFTNLRATTISYAYIKFLNLNFVLFDDELVTEAEHKTRDNLAEFSQT